MLFAAPSNSSGNGLLELPGGIEVAIVLVGRLSSYLRHVGGQECIGVAQSGLDHVADAISILCCSWGQSLDRFS